MKKLALAFRRVLLITALSLPNAAWGAAVPETFSTANGLPPAAGVYVTPAQWHAAYANGIVIRDVRHRRFTQNLPIPPLGGTQTHAFGSTLNFELSTDNGKTFTPASGSALVSVQVTHSTDDATGKSFFDTEMTQLDLTSGTIMIRESPTLPSRGQTTERPVSGGYMISSFFDIFTEVSLDGGQTWTPAQQAAHVELRNDPAMVPPVPEPTPLLPPPNDVYVSPALYHALFAQGIVITDVKHKVFTDSQPPPPPGGTATHTFSSQLDMMFSIDGGTTYQSIRAPGTVTVRVSGASWGSDMLFDTEMTALNFTAQAGTPPTLIMVRESPTLPSRGQTEIQAQADGTYRISSFFDIFPELSLDGGATWSPATNGAVRMQLQQQAPEQPAPSPNLPPNGTYISPQMWHALYANGIIISNVSHLEFTQTQPPPTNGTIIENFNSQVAMDLLRPGLPPIHVTAPAAVSVRVTSLFNSGNTRFFDTEMLQLNISGGSLPAGMMVRESPSKASLGRTSVRLDPPVGTYHISSFFDVFTELSLDNGQTWTPAVGDPGTMRLRTPTSTPIAITCPLNMTVGATGPAGAIVTFTIGASGGCGGALTVVANPPSGSLFPIGTTTVNCVATDPCGNVVNCSFTVTVFPPTANPPEYFFLQPGLPPTNSVYISPALYHQLYAAGIIIRDVRHRRFTRSAAAPALGSTSVESFGSQVAFEVSTDNGNTFQPASGTADVTVRVTHTQDAGGTSFFDTEMLALNLTSGTLMLRESPTLASHGQTTVRPVPGGYMISSFFDIFTELSTDGGHTWMPAQQAGHVELRNDPSLAQVIPQPTRLLPPPNGSYISPTLYHALYAQGIVIKDVRHKYFTQSVLPPASGATTSESFNSQLDLEVSRDGGNTFQAVRVSAPVSVQLTGSSFGSDAIYDTEMTALSASFLVGTASLMIRESPTEPSRGGTEIRAQADGTFRISSFFDVFTELSLDGGQSWSPSSNGPVRMELTQNAPERTLPSPNLPPLNNQYISPAQWHALYANGIVITNVSHFEFTTSQPPPTNGAALETFNSQVQMDVLMPPTLTPVHVIAPANVAVLVSNKTSSGSTRFFDTEMLSLNISGGSLPPGIMVRESPSKASLGRTSIRTNAADGTHRISSFFDIFTELSIDGGQTWSPAVSIPGPVALTPLPYAPFGVTCPADITVVATSAGGAFVSYSIPPILLFPDCPFGPFVITGSPVSGSFFPIGTTTVTLTGSDGCGEHPTCTFHITVLPRKVIFPVTSLPPLNGAYISPAQWHALYANGIIITNAVHRRFTQTFPPPPAGQTNTHSFGSQVDFLLSTDNGKTFQPKTGNGVVTVTLANIGTQGNDQVYTTEMKQLDLSGGSMGGLMIRESPSKASLGETRISSAPGGFMISSFFDVFTELSTDGGQTWSPASQPGHMELRLDPGATPTTLPNVQFQGGNPVFSLATQPGLMYLFEYKNNLADPTWFTFGGAVGNGAQTVQTDALGNGAMQRFYRVRVEEVPPPSP